MTPLAGQTGVEATWGGTVGVTSFADIATDGASGMLVFGTTSATIDNQGTITTNVTTDGAMALDVYANGDISISNSGEIFAYSAGIYDVTAINTYSSGGDVLIDNLATGTITATAQDGNAIGILSFATSAGTFSNEGAITATSVHGAAIGVLDQAYNGDATVTNSGSITANATYYQGIAVLASSTNGSASVDNSGSITAFGGEDQSFGIQASGLLGSDIANSGTITVHSTAGSITGALASTYEGDASVSNGATGSIFGYTSGTEDLVGMQADSVDGAASVDNAGFIQLIGRVGQSTVIGMAAYSGTGSTIVNNGYLLAGSYSGATIAAIAVAQTGDASITNGVAGYVRSVGVSFDPYSSSTGLIAQALDGNASVANDGRIVSSSIYGDGAGIRALASGGDASVTNTGDVAVAARLFSNALGLSAVSSTGLATVENTGHLSVQNQILLGRVEDINTIRGLQAFSYAGTTVNNSGIVDVGGAWLAKGIIAVATYGDVVVNNSQTGQLLVRGLNAFGIEAQVTYGDFRASVDNAGSIKVIQTGNCYCSATIPAGTGIAATSLNAAGIDVSNSGSIDVTSQHNSYGIRTMNYFFGGDSVVENSGTIDIFSSGLNSVNFGMLSWSTASNASLVNSGDITIEMAAKENTNYFNVDLAVGMRGVAGAPHNSNTITGNNIPDGAGDALVVNSGAITILAAQAAYGMQADGQYQQAVISNSGDIRLVSEGLHSTGTGVFASAPNSRYAEDYSYNSPNNGAIVDNTGDIWVQAQEGARGIRTFSDNESGAYVSNSGDVTTLAAGGFAYGVLATSFNNLLLTGGTPISSDLVISNSGSISAINHAGTNEDDFRGGVKAMGVLATSFTNNLVVENTGDIVAEATAATCDSAAFAYACFSGATVGSAVGILAASGHGHYHGYYAGDITVVNAGTISASVHSSSSTEMKRYGSYYSGGAFAAGILTVGDYGDIDSTNAGIITVSAKGEGYTPEGQTLEGWATTAAGMMASTYGSLDEDVSEIALTNIGSITVSAEAVYADGTALAIGIGAQHDTFYYDGGYYGIFDGESNGEGIITVTNAGSISVVASVTGEGTGAATANGISAVSVATNGAVNIANDGRIQAVATGPGAVYANGVLGSAVSVATVLGEDSVVVVQATGLSGTAIALSLSGDALSGSNAGILQAEFIGGGDTFGARIASTGAVAFSNSGTINATDADLAVGVQLDSLTATTLVNSGTISAFSGGAGIAVRTGDSTDLIQNTGTLNGAVATQAGNDTLDNAVGALWHATGSSDFGAGIDTVTSAGTILLDNAAISLGDAASFDNAFSSSGLIRVSGDNTLDLGAQNAIAFTNSGIIDFRDGAADDILTLNGDFDGNGTINLDVSGLNSGSDLLYVNGNVVSGSTSKINVALMTLPTTKDANIPLVYVSGDSTASSFALGEVRYDPDQSFLTLTYDTELEAAIDPSNAIADVFSLGMKVSGLSDSGTLAATIAPGAQSLLSSQVGTWRQRMGVIDSFRRGGVAMWARLFQDSGVVSPQHSASNFGQDGNFAFDQRNSGTEVGADFALSDEFSLGLLAAKADGRQHLLGEGQGSSRIEGDSVGAYATWISPSGFYLDGSYRRMSFDAKLNTSVGQIRTSGDADAVSLEAGYAWTLGNGLKVEPQLQYTRITVDDIQALPGRLASFQSEGGDSSRVRAGVMFRQGFASGSAVWTPYASINAVREFDGENSFSINDDFSGRTSADGTNALVEAGLNVDIGRLSVFGGANWQDGGALESIVSGQVGMRFAW
ncbi:autotransporter outer membrane beta-barrel domain-containing protein [Pseudoxanthomonas gei]|uniref:autotransporter outer membrane beta-barrel domain-containing protein n=1 Tax=Pseudoxanthomonas gei TaxID=1383030 RepID=UPI0013911EF4